MNTGQLIGTVGAVVLVAAVWIWVTRNRPSAPEPEPTVEWRRPLNHRIAHAFLVAELRVERYDAEALGICGQWPVATLVPVAELVPDDHAPRCAACERAVARMEGHRE